jgi:ribonuclease HI
MSTSLSFLRNDNAGQREGLDYWANTLLIRKLEKKRYSDYDENNKLRFGMLRWGLGGAIHTAQRMHRVHRKQKHQDEQDGTSHQCHESDICEYCGKEVETAEHIYLQCPRWEEHRHDLYSIASRDEVMQWPACTRHTGLFTENTALNTWKAAHMAPEDIEPSPPSISTDDEEWVVDGFLRVATDGAEPHQAHEPLRSSGCGFFFGPGHSHNCKFAMKGLAQGSARAEVRAACRVLAWAWRPTELLVDNDSTVLGLRRVIAGKSIRRMANRDLWRRAQQAVHAKGSDFFRVMKVTSHDKDPDQDAQVSEWNRHADELAVAGARDRVVPQDIVQASLRRSDIAIAYHDTMIDTLIARKNAKTIHQLQHEDAELELFGEANEDPFGHGFGIGFNRFGDDANNTVMHKDNHASSSPVIGAAAPILGNSIVTDNDRRSFPSYAWPNADGSGWGDYLIALPEHPLPQPPNHSTCAGRRAWEEPVELWHAICWYWSQLRWAEGEITAAELLIDFLLITQCELHGAGHGRLGDSLEALRTRFMKLSNKITIVSKWKFLPRGITTVPGAGSLHMFGLGTAPGFSGHAKLLYPAAVGKLFAKRAREHVMTCDGQGRPLGAVKFNIQISEYPPALWIPPASLDKPAAAHTMPGAGTTLYDKAYSRWEAFLANNPASMNRLDAAITPPNDVAILEWDATALAAASGDSRLADLQRCAKHNSYNMYNNKHDVWISNSKYTCRLCGDSCPVDCAHLVRKAFFRKGCKTWKDIKSKYAATSVRS